MEPRALRARIQPVLVQDFDAVREEFVLETGSQDPRAFVRHLRDWSLIPADLADRLLEELSTEPRHTSAGARPQVAVAPPPAASGPDPAPAPAPTPDRAPPSEQPRGGSVPPAPEPSREIRVKVQRAAAPPPPPPEPEPGDLLNLDEIEEVASFRTRTAAPAEEHDVGLFDGADEPAADEPAAEDPPTESDGALPAWLSTLEDEDTGVTEDGRAIPVGVTAPDDDATTVMRWGDGDGEVDPDSATKHMDRAELRAQLAADRDREEAAPPRDGNGENALRDLIDIEDLHDAPTPVVSPAIDASMLERDGGTRGSDDETMIRERAEVPLVSFPPEPEAAEDEVHTVAPLSPMPDPARVDPPPSDDGDEYDPEAETVHIGRTRITQATPPPAARRSVPPKQAGPPPSLPPAPEVVPPPPPPPAGSERSAEARGAPDDSVPTTVLRRPPPEPAGPPAAEPRAAGAAPRAADPAQRYGLADLIADDGIARTYEAYDAVLDRTVAVRLLNAEAAENPVVVQRFEREIRVAAQLPHPAVPVVLEVLGPTSYVHAPVEGPSMAMVLAEAREALGSRRPLPAHAARDVLLRQLVQVCDAVAYAHERGIIHRDLRPDNIVLGPHGGVRVLDWGIARPIGDGEPAIRLDPVDEDPRTLIGTPGYCSPEQANGNHRALDARSDVYALGLVLFEILTLRPAVSGISPSAKLGRQQQGQLDPLVHAFGAPIAPPLREVVQRALQVHPDDRYPTAEAMADALRRALRGESTGWLATAGRAAGRHPVLLVFAGLALGTGWVVAALALALPFLT